MGGVACNGVGEVMRVVWDLTEYKGSWGSAATAAIILSGAFLCRAGIE